MAIKFQGDSDVLFSGIMTNLCDSIKIDRTYSPLKWKKTLLHYGVESTKQITHRKAWGK